MPDAPQWVDPFSPEATREVTAKILTGMNYRLFYESVTRKKIIGTYKDLAKIAKKHPKDDEKWKALVRGMVEEGTPDNKQMRQWLVGLTKKTAENLGIKTEEYPELFDRLMDDVESTIGVNRRDMALLLWCGSATLTIRGSQKARIGKSLERSIAGAALTAIGLKEERGDFRLNILADEEVSRETDAEVKTPRGFVRMEVGLIGAGNSEVISDKVGRMDRNGIIILDILPSRSTAHEAARQRGVRLIQLRNNHPVEELRQHLASLNVAGVQPEPIERKDVEDRILNMPISMFRRGDEE